MLTKSVSTKLTIQQAALVYLCLHKPKSYSSYYWLSQGSTTGTSPRICFHDQTKNLLSPGAWGIKFTPNPPLSGAKKPEYLHLHGICAVITGKFVYSIFLLSLHLSGSLLTTNSSKLSAITDFHFFTPRPRLCTTA